MFVAGGHQLQLPHRGDDQDPHAGVQGEPGHHHGLLPQLGILRRKYFRVRSSELSLVWFHEGSSKLKHD